MNGQNDLNTMNEHLYGWLQNEGAMNSRYRDFMKKRQDRLEKINTAKAKLNKAKSTYHQDRDKA